MANTREKLIELLTAYFGVDPAYYGIEAQHLADHLIANGVTFATDNNVGGKWISVEDRLPKYDQAVLCYKSDRGVRFGKVLAATYADGVQAFMDCERKYAFGATHWMPLPEPPDMRGET